MVQNFRFGKFSKFRLIFSLVSNFRFWFDFRLFRRYISFGSSFFVSVNFSSFGNFFREVYFVWFRIFRFGKFFTFGGVSTLRFIWTS